jgi:hypothetical protein
MKFVSDAVKVNIDHLENASEVADLIKTILVLKKEVIPSNTNFELLNPKIDADLMKLKIEYIQFITFIVLIVTVSPKCSSVT